MRKILLLNGLVYLQGKLIRTDLLIAGSSIVSQGEYPDLPGEAETIDCTGLCIFPGGIDPHVHMHLPGPSGFSSDDFETGSRAAIAGGTTSFIDFVTPCRGQSLIEALHKRRIEATNSLCDVKFHVSPVEWTAKTGEEIIRCIREEGIASFKVYMAYRSSIGLRDEDIFKVMKTAGRHGGLVAIHCEADEEIENLKNGYLSEGMTSPKYHPLSRPNAVEAEAVKRALNLAEKAGCPLYIVHVSTRESLDYIEKAQSQGLPVYAETCPQYLLLDNSMYDHPFDRASAYVMSPPLRKNEDREALWQAIRDGVIHTVGTDHCPFSLEQKRRGIHDFTKIPNGAGGIEHRLSLLYTHGIWGKRISLGRFIEVSSENPAKIFGWYPQKGMIKEGADADLVIWDPDANQIISSKTHHQNCDLNIYEGLEVKGLPVHTMMKGSSLFLQ
ncbi:MAG: dihydropyrimidinase [Bacteroidales bacterium]|nr:dihydropyrimidinase [Bacteroidales bacterium]